MVEELTARHSSGGKMSKSLGQKGGGCGVDGCPQGVPLQVDQLGVWTQFENPQNPNSIPVTALRPHPVPSVEVLRRSF